MNIQNPSCFTRIYPQKRVNIACFKSLAIALIQRNLSLSIILKKWEKFIINGFQSSSYCFLILISKIWEQEKKEIWSPRLKKNKKKQPKRMKLYLQTPLNYRTSKILAFSLSLFSLFFLYISENTRNTQMISTYRLKMFKIISKKYIGFVVKCAVRMQCSCVQLVNYPTTVQFLVK